MAVNDLMMKIQLLVESGKSSTELNRLQQALKTLQNQLTALDRTQLTPLTRDLESVKRAAASLKTVNLGNFATSIDAVKKSFAGLGIATGTLDQLKTAYQNLNAQLNSGAAQRYQQEILRLQSAIRDTRTQEIVPLQNAIRSLSAQKGLDKALQMDTLSAQTRVARAQVRFLNNELKNIPRLNIGGSLFFNNPQDEARFNSIRNTLKTLTDDIVKNDLDLAKANQAIVSQYNQKIASEKQSLANSQNKQALQQNELKNNRELLKIEQDKEKALVKQVSELTKINTAQARAKIVQLQGDLSTTRTKQRDLQGQIRETEQAAKAEMQRIRALDQSTKAMGRQSGAVSSLGRLFKEAGGPAKEFFAAMRFALGPQMAGFAVAGSVLGLAEGFIGANKAVENLIRGLNAISGGQGAAEFEQLVSTANRLGVSIQDAAHSFLQLKASAEGTGLEGEKIQKIFASFSNALNVTGADTVTMNRAFRSISQMISKGQLYAEELKGQLAEALPGAIQVFARALDVTPKKLMALIKSGEIEGRNLERVLALVAKELDKTYKVANEQDFTFTQKAALAQNALTELFITVGNTGVWKALGNAMLDVRTILNDLQSDIPAIVENIRFLSQSIEEIQTPKNDWGAVRAGAAESGKFILQSFADLPLNIKTLVELLVNELGLLGAELYRVSNEIGLPILESLDRVGVSIKSLFTDVSNNVSFLLSGISLGFRESFYIPVVQLIDDLQKKMVGLLESVAGGFEFAGMKETADAIRSSLSGLQNGTNFDELNQETVQLKKNFEELRAAVNRGYSSLLDKNLKDLAKRHQEIRDAVEQEYQIMKQSAQQGIDDALAYNDAKKKQRDTQIELNQALKEQDALAKRNRGTRNDILSPVDSTTAQQQALSISKERMRIEKEILDIQQAYQDNLLDLNSKKYQRWADQGSMTQAGAKFLIESAKADQLRKAWTLAQDKVEQYNQELNKGDQANADQLKFLSQLAQDQLKYAESKAKEVGDEYKLKQIMEARVELLKSLQSNGVDKILAKAELKLTGQDVARQQVQDFRTFVEATPAIQTILTQLPNEAAYQLRNQTVPVTFTLPDTANTIQADWQSLLQSLPTPGFLTCPIEVDDTQVVPTVSNTLSDIQRLFGEQSFQFDTTQPIQSLDQLKFAYVSTKAEIVSASQTAQQNPIIPRVDATSAVSEGAKAGQAVATAANQAAAQNPVKLTTDSSNYDLFSGLDSSKLNQGIQTAMNQAQSTVKTSVAQMNQELLTKLGQREGGFQIKIETVVDQTSLEGWKRQVSLLSASDNRVSLRADTAELDQEFRRIDGQLAEWNRTAGQGLIAGFVSASQQAQNFGLLVDQVNQKMRAIQNPNALPPVKPVIEPVVEAKTAYQQVQEQLNQSNPITISADAAPMIGQIQHQLDQLRASGATKIEVTVDQKSGKLIVTADTSQAKGDVTALIASIRDNPVVQTVNVVFNVPELSLPTKTQYVDVVYRSSSSASSSSPDGEPNRWGGYISGYGGGDRIRALLEPGEFVLRKEAVKALGLSSLTKLNNLGFNAKIPKPSPTIDRVSIPRFANGGLVQGQPIVINIPGGKSIQVSGSRDSAMQLANLLTRVGRAV